MNNDVLCTGCRETLKGSRNADIVHFPVFDYDGTLEFISLAHRACRPSWSVFDAWPKSMSDAQAQIAATSVPVQS